MKKIVCADNSTAEQISKLLNTEKIDIEAASEGECDVRILRSDEGQESDLKTIYCGGWIACGTALALAKKLEMPTIVTGKLLNCLEVKIRKCSLGCFE